MTKSAIISVILILLIVGIFLFFEFIPSLRVPILRGDEAKSGNTAICIIKNLATYGDIYIGKRHFPLGCNRHGVLDAYIQAPFICFGGNTLEALRIRPMIIGVFIIIFTFFLGCRLFNPTVSIIASVLIALNPFFRHFVKLGGFFGCSMPLIQIIAVWLFFKYHLTKKPRYFIVTAFVLGVGMNSKGYFIWFILAAFFTWLIIYFPRYRIKLSTFFLALLAFLLGALPVLYYYFKTNFFYKGMMHNVHRIYLGVNNSGILHNLSVTTHYFWRALTNNYVLDKKYFALPVFIFVGFVLFLVIRILTCRPTFFSRNRIIALLALVVIVLINSSFTLTDNKLGHQIIMFPFVQMLISVSLWETIWFLRNIWLRLLFATILFVSIFCYYGKASLVEFQTAKRTLQKINSSEDDQFIAQWLVSNSIYHIGVFFWQTSDIMKFYSGMKIDIKDYGHLYYGELYKIDTLHKQKVFMKIDNFLAKVKTKVFLLLPGKAGDTQEVYKYLVKRAEELQIPLKENRKFFRSRGKLARYELIQIN